MLTPRGVQAPPQLAQKPSPGLLGVVAGTWVTGTSSLSHPALATAVRGVPAGTHPLCLAGGAVAERFPRQVNDTSFQNLTREEAVEYLMSLPLGEDITLWTQSKQDSE